MTRPTNIDAPPRGTRPGNRRELIREAAAALFAERGYGHVSLNDVAAAVNVGQSALYRHYSGKAELLYDAVGAQLDQVSAHLRVGPVAGLTEIARTLVCAVLDNRHAGVLWQRESRNLVDAERTKLRSKVSEVNRWLGDALRSSRTDLGPEQAELLASCAIDAVMSVSFHRLSLPRRDFEDLLTDLCLRILELPPSTTSSDRSTPRRARPATRSDEIVDAATRLFAQRGYPAVSIDDIGAAVGIAGPSVYNHFESKHAILLAAMDRGNARLIADLEQAMSTGGTSEQALRRVSDTYVTITLDHSDLTATLIGETIHLEDPEKHRIRETQRRFIDDWVTLLRAHRPDDSQIVARIKVQAAQMVANDIARTPHLRRIPGFRQTVHEACWAVQQ